MSIKLMSLLYIKICPHKGWKINNFAYKHWKGILCNAVLGPFVLELF